MVLPDRYAVLVSVTGPFCGSVTGTSTNNGGIVKYTKKQLVDRLAACEKIRATQEVRIAYLEAELERYVEMINTVIRDRGQESSWGAEGRCIGDGGPCPRSN